MSEPLQAVFQRTHTGSREALSAEAPLTAAQRKLLLVVTGYTPLVVVAPGFPSEHQLVETASRLVNLGLVEEVARR